MKRKGFEKRKELKNRVINDEMKIEYAVYMREDDVNHSSGHIAQNAGNAINKSYRKPQTFTRDIKDRQL